MSINKEQIVKIVKEINRPDWMALTSAVDDNDFISNLLTSQEIGILKSIAENANQIRGYHEYIPNIISKYYTWEIYRDSGASKLRKSVSDLTDELHGVNEQVKIIKETGAYINGATSLVAYAKIFEKTSIDHAKKARWRLLFYVLSLIGLVTVVGLIFFLSISDYPNLKGSIARDIGTLPLNSIILVLKVIILVFFFQVSQFIRKIYCAEKHLEEIYRHRSDTLNSLHAVYMALRNENERDKILSAGALFAYERGETGYITTKEGAGAGENMLESILRGKLN